MTAHNFAFLTDEPATAVHKLLREFGLCMDAGFRGELERLFETRGFRRAYYRRRGLTIDAFAEMLCDRRITGRRLSTVEIIDLLEMMLTVKTARPRRRRVSHSEIEHDAQRATRNRLRKFECSACGQKARGTRASDLLCGTCYANDGRIVQLVRRDPLPEEILIATAEAA